MSEETLLDISKINLSSTVFPSDEDMALWNALTDGEKRLLIQQDEEEGFQLGVEKPETLEARLRRVRAEKTKIHE